MLLSSVDRFSLLIVDVCVACIRVTVLRAFVFVMMCACSWTALEIQNTLFFNK